MADPKTEMAVAKAEAVKTEKPAEPKTEAAQPGPVKAEPAKPEPPKAAHRAEPKKKPVKAAVKAAAVPRKKGARKPAARKTNVKNQARQGAKKMNKQTRETVQNGQFAADQFKAVFGDVNERARSAMEKSAKVAEEFADLTRGNMEAFVASSKAAAKGVEALSQEAADYGRRSFEGASAALKGFADVKSATDFFKLQGDFARSAFDSLVAENARLSETMLKVAGEVAEPITSRYSVAAERVKNLAA